MSVFTKVEDFLISKLKLLITLAIITTIVFFSTRRYKLIEDKGRITIAKVISFSPDASGVSLDVEVYFNRKKFRDVLNYSCGDCVGHFIFVKVFGKDAIYLGPDLVPDCILKNPIPPKGWDTIPRCHY